jgi:hypothetical protein
MLDLELDLFSHIGVLHVNVQVSQSLDDIANVEIVLNSLLSSLVEAHVFTLLVGLEAT